MANLTTNSLFIVSALVFVVGLLFVAYPYLTLTCLVLCALGYSYYCYSPTLHRHYVYFTSVLWPAACGSDRVESISFASTLLGGTDLPSPIPHVPSGIETAKSRRSPVDEIVSSTPRSSPISSHGSGPSTAHSTAPMQLQLQMRNSAEVAPDSRQLNFGRISTPKTSRTHSQDMHPQHLEANCNQRLRNRAGSGRAIQTTAGPLLSSARYGPTFDAGIFVNVNSPGFTDRLVRCANDNTAYNWGHGGLSAQQDRYNSVGLFPIVHLNSHSPPQLTSKNSQKAPNCSVRVRIAPPVYPEQRQNCYRGNSIQMRSFIPSRDWTALRRNEMAKSVLESLQEASRKRIYSQCQEAMEDDSGKKRQRKDHSALPNPNCDMYQYRHIRAPQVPSSMSMGAQNDIHHQVKRLHDDPASKASEPKRQRHYVKPHSSNNEISSSLSSSKTLLQQLNSNKRKAESDSDDCSGKLFKDSSNAAMPVTSSRWLQSRPCDEGESSARTQEVVRSQRKNSESCSPVTKKIVPKNVVTESVGCTTTSEGTLLVERVITDSQKGSDKVETDLASKLFRKEIVSRSQPKASLLEKKGSSWTQVPPAADERCLQEQGSSSELERPERFQSLLSRMCGQDIHSVKQTENPASQTTSESVGGSSVAIASAASDVSNSHHSSLLLSSSSAVVSLSTVTVSSASLTAANPGFQNMKKPSPSMATATSSLPSSSASLTIPSLFSASTSPPQTTLSAFATPAMVPQEKANFKETKDQLDGPVSLAPSSAAAPAKPMFSFTSPSPQNSTNAQMAPPVFSGTSITGSNNPVSFSQTMFKISVPSGKATSESSIVKAAPSTSPSNPTTTMTTQSSGFSFLSGQPKPVLVSLSNNSIDSAANTPKPHYSFGGNTSTSNQQLHVNGPTNTGFSTTLSGVFETNATQSQGPAVPANNGGFSFSGTSGALFGQTTSGPVSTVFSLTPSASVTNSTAAKAVGISSAVPEAKSTSGSGSITFGTVSSAAALSTKSPSFSFSAPTIGSPGSSTGSETPKATIQLGSFSSNATSSSTGFNNAPQGIFNGFNTVANSTAPALTFGSSIQPSQPQTQEMGGPFGSSSSNINFSAGVQQSPGEQQVQQGFGISLPTASSPPFGSSSSSLFGSSVSNVASFGGQTATGNPPTFGGQTASGNPPRFGGQAATSNPPAFGGQTTSINPPTFGGQTTSINPPTFGGQASATNPPTFGAQATSSPLFGGQTTSSNPPSFGGPTATRNPPAFGGQTATRNPPAFGGQANSSNSSVFSGIATTPNNTSLFGSQTTSSNPPAFGGLAMSGTSLAFGGQNLSSNPPVFGLSSTNPPAFGSSSNSPLAPSFGAASPPAFGASQLPADPSFGANTSVPSAAPINSSFNFGAPADKPSAPSFNFGGSNAQAFSFGNDQPQQNTGSGLFQFGQIGNPNATSPFQFSSPTSPPGSVGFSMGSGPAAPQRSRSLQNRRRRI